MYILASGRFYQAVDNELPNLKSEVKASCGRHIRRVDRFIQLALIGAHRCSSGRELPKNTGLYLASGDGPKANLNQSLEELYRHQQPLMPLNFINMVSNAATFYVAQTLAIESVSLFNSHQYFAFQQVLQLAEMDLTNKITEFAMVGSVDECCEPLAVQREVLSAAADEQIAEGSYWFLLSENDANAIAKIQVNKQYADKSKVINAISTVPDISNACIAFASDAIRQEFLAALEKLSINLTSYTCHVAKHHSATAAVVSAFIESDSSEGNALFYINQDGLGNYRLLFVTR